MTTKEKIFEAALKLFSEKGFNASSVRDITKEAGVTVAALYNHFRSKNELLKAIYDYYTNVFMARDTAKPDYDKLLEQFGPMDLMEYLTKSYIESMKNEKLKKLTRIILMEQYTNEVAGEIAYKDRQRLISSMQDLLLAMYRKGLVKTEDPSYAGMLLGYVYLGFAADNIYYYYLKNLDSEFAAKKQIEVVRCYLKKILISE